MPHKLSVAEWIAAERLIAIALAEDLGQRGDVTSKATIPESNTGVAELVARTDGFIAGVELVTMVCQAVDKKLQVQTNVPDGSKLTKGQVIGTIAGPMRLLLAAERTALNFLQRLSGIATLTNKYVEAAGHKTKVLDTRKTTPGWRLLEKYAVRCGGGHNHRVGLYDAILIKDNHLASLGGGPDAVRKAVMHANDLTPKLVVEVEVDNWDLYLAALQVKPDIILLDNMNVELMAKCVAKRNADAVSVLLEASGGINLQTIATIAATGVDRISVGAITHSAPALDIALDFRKQSIPV